MPALVRGAAGAAEQRPKVQLSLSIVSIDKRQHSVKKVTLAEAQRKTPLEH